ncbi:hypothetical protein G7054_g13571 [Neopestalotiopsis clavispora]|nr:hypothetical protein G7054_g13571 [Neopestalotiopsis clavispora]
MIPRVAPLVLSLVYLVSLGRASPAERRSNHTDSGLLIVPGDPPSDHTESGLLIVPGDPPSDHTESGLLVVPADRPSNHTESGLLIVPGDRPSNNTQSESTTTVGEGSSTATKTDSYTEHTWTGHHAHHTRRLERPTIGPPHKETDPAMKRAMEPLEERPTIGPPHKETDPAMKRAMEPLERPTIGPPHKETDPHGYGTLFIVHFMVQSVDKFNFMPDLELEIVFVVYSVFLPILQVLQSNLWPIFKLNSIFSWIFFYLVLQLNPWCSFKLTKCLFQPFFWLVLQAFLQVIFKVVFEVVIQLSLYTNTFSRNFSISNSSGAGGVKSSNGRTGSQATVSSSSTSSGPSAAVSSPDTVTVHTTVLSVITSTATIIEEHFESRETASNSETGIPSLSLSETGSLYPLPTILPESISELSESASSDASEKSPVLTSLPASSTYSVSPPTTATTTTTKSKAVIASGSVPSVTPFATAVAARVHAGFNGGLMVALGALVLMI